MVSRIVSIIFFVSAITFFSCSSRPAVPSQFPNEEKMVDILADIHMMEATILNLKDQKLRRDSVKTSFYKFILQKHGISKDELDSAIKWYTNHPIIYSEVYEDVIAALSDKEAVVKNAIKEQQDEEERLQELMKPDTLWYADTIILVDGGVFVDSLTRVKVDVDTIIEGHLTYQATYQLSEKDTTFSAKAYLFALYSDSTIDTVSVDIECDKLKYCDVSNIYTLSKDTSLISFDLVLMESDSLMLDSTNNNIEVRDASLIYQKLLPDEE